MIILEIFMVLFIIALLLFGKVEIRLPRAEFNGGAKPFFFKLSLMVFGKKYPLISINDQDTV
jgi:hypothetical protein